MENKYQGLDSQNKLLLALTKGPVRAIGGTVYDSEMFPLFGTTEMRDNVRTLNKLKIHRIDSGGSPTWDIIE
jgi:hypothetical protein